MHHTPPYEFAVDLSLNSWSSKGFSNFFLQLLWLANLKGLGHLFVHDIVVAAESMLLIEIDVALY